MPSVLDKAVKIEEKSPCHILNPRRLRALKSTAFFIDYQTGKSKTCLINFPRHSSDECKALGNFGSKYAETIPTKDCGHDPITRKKFNNQQENDYIVKIAVDEILVNENEKGIATKEAHENVESYFDDNKLYQIDNMSLEDIKKKLSDVSVSFNANLKIHMGLKIEMK